MTPAEKKMNQIINDDLEGLTDFSDYQDQHLENEGFKKGFRTALVLPEVQALADCVEYFVLRAEGRHPTDGYIRSNKTHAKFKEALSAWKKFIGEEK